MNWDYIAGFMDGEGCIHLTKTRCKISIVQLTKNQAVLDQIKEFLDGHNIHTWISLNGNREGPSGTMSQLCMSAATDCYRFLEEISKRSIVKLPKALKAMELIRPVMEKKRDVRRRVRLAIQEYHTGISSVKAAGRHGLYHGTLRNEMNLLGIPIRGRSEANKLSNSADRLQEANKRKRSQNQ